MPLINYIFKFQCKKDDITTKKVKIASIIEDLFNKYKGNTTLNNYRHQFSKCIYYVQTIRTKYSEVLDDRDQNVSEFFILPHYLQI